MKQTICKVHKKCGGCRYMDVAYQEQLHEKHNYIQSLYPKSKVENVVGMDNPYHYRHKVYATFGYDAKQNLIAGMYEENSHHLVFEPNCLIQHPLANAIISSMVSIAKQMHIEPYNEDTGYGVLRHAYIRISHLTQKALLVIVIGSKQLPGAKRFVQSLLRMNPNIDSIVLNYNHDNTSMILGERERVLYGKGYIIDRIGGYTFRISSKSFYQVNPEQTEKLYAKAIELANLDKNKTVLDACCGIGTISLLAAKYAKEVVGVEINPNAIEDAKNNAYKNHVKNAYFYCDKAENFIDRLMDTPDVVILDPPRAGMGKPFMEQLGKMNVPTIVYISCYPKTQQEDISVIQTHGYKVKQIIPFDLFPFSQHIETVALLTRKYSDAVNVVVEVDTKTMTAKQRPPMGTYKNIRAWVLENFDLKVSTANIAAMKDELGLDKQFSYDEAGMAAERRPGCPEEKKAAIIKAFEHFGMIESQGDKA